MSVLVVGGCAISGKQPQLTVCPEINLPRYYPLSPAVTSARHHPVRPTLPACTEVGLLAQNSQPPPKLSGTTLDLSAGIGSAIIALSRFWSGSSARCYNTVEPQILAEISVRRKDRQNRSGSAAYPQWTKPGSVSFCYHIQTTVQRSALAEGGVPESDPIRNGQRPAS